MPGRDRRRVLIWTEAHEVGGCDRMLVDLLRGLDERWAVRIAGLPNPEWDAWLQERLPWALPKATIPVASLPGSPLTRLRGRLAGPEAGTPRLLSEADADVPLGVRAAVAALRYRHAVTNFFRLKALFSRARPDVVFINNGGYPGGESCRVAAVAAKAAGVPRAVHFVHNMALPPYWPPSAERRLDGVVDRAVDAWATAARRATDALATTRGVGRGGGTLHTVHYGIPAPALSPPPAGLRAELGHREGALNLAVVAAFEPRKGHLVLLDALAELRSRSVPVHAVLVGTGPELPAVRRRAAELGLTSAVTFAGRRSDIDDVLRASDALVLPSLSHECLPYAILEAMGNARAVVSTDVGGVAEEVVEGRTGHVVRPGDPAALATALAGLAADRDRTIEFGRAGRERLEREFTVSRMVDGVTALWSG